MRIRHVLYMPIILQQLPSCNNYRPITITVTLPLPSFEDLKEELVCL
jgi:hypothetical protein